MSGRECYSLRIALALFPIGTIIDQVHPFFPIGMNRCRLHDIFPNGKMTGRAKTPPTRVTSVSDFGTLVRDVRKRTELDQSTTADLVGVGPRFLGELERGKPSLRLGLVLKVLERLGLEVWVAPRGWKP